VSASCLEQMCSRGSTITADVDAARAVHLSDSEGAVGPRILSIALDEDCLSFAVAGFEGEFSAFLADPYPNGETAVYGPDDLEFQHVGTVTQVLAGVLQDLDEWRARRESTSGVDVDEVHDDPNMLSNDEVDDADGCELSMTNAADWIFDDSPVEPKLQDDLANFRSSYGESAIEFTQLSIDAWRVRMRVPLTVQGGSGDKVPLLTDTTANAWGLHPENELVIELHLPVVGYLASQRSPAVVKAIKQDKFPNFALERQLIQILNDFCALVVGITVDLTTRDDLFDEVEWESVRTYETKKTSVISHARIGGGFLVSLLRYTQLRIPTVHEYCAICDKAFGMDPMMLRTVCCRELCTYQFGEFGSMITTADGVNTQAEIVDLLVCMLLRAALSARRDIILDPYPRVYGGQNGKEKVFDPQAKDFNKLQETVEAIVKLRQENAATMGASWSTLRSRMPAEGLALVKWVVASNRSYLAPLQDDERIAEFETPYQYLLISAPPDRENRFQELKSQYGSTFAFHGSPAENWHSILRNGLKNASNTRLMTTGAAHGPGIYLALDSQTSLGYADRALRAALGPLATAPLSISQPTSPELKRQRTGNRHVENVEQIVMLAVCEVIEHPQLKKIPTQRIWVAPSEETVITRFFLVYAGAMKLRTNVSITGLSDQINQCMKKLRVGTQVRS